MIKQHQMAGIAHLRCGLAFTVIRIVLSDHLIQPVIIVHVRIQRGTCKVSSSHAASDNQNSTLARAVQWTVGKRYRIRNT